MDYILYVVYQHFKSLKGYGSSTSANAASSVLSIPLLALAGNILIIIFGPVIDTKSVLDYLSGVSKFIQIPLAILFFVTLITIEAKYISKYFKKRLPTIKKRYLNYKPNFFVRYSVVGLVIIVIGLSVLSVPFTIFWVHSWHVN